MSTHHRNPIKVMNIIILALLVALIVIMLVWKPKTEGGEKVSYWYPKAEPADDETPPADPATPPATE